MTTIGQTARDGAFRTKHAQYVIVLLCLVVACTYYAALLSTGGTGLFAPVPHGLTFNSMLEHLLNGAFDVDPQTIGDEGALRDGRVYAYFGLLPALLRLPFLVSANFAALDLTRLSCLAAVTLMASFKVASAMTVWRAYGRSERLILLVLLIAAILFSGPQIQFLRALIYQEVVFWAGALAAAFVYLVLRGSCASRGFDTRVMSGLALAAGLCLLTRVSTALGLYLAFGLLWLQLIWMRARKPVSIVSITTAASPLLIPMLIVLIFAAAAGYINYERWGNPLLFTDPHAYLWPVVHNAPDRFLRLDRYGEFNPVRLGYGLVYYFFPIWPLRGADGALLWSEFQQRTIDSVELPPASFLLSDPLIIALGVFALVRLVKRDSAIDWAIAIPILLGLFAPILLMLMLISMTFRYRMEFYPFFELCAFLGFSWFLRRRKEPPVLPLVAATAIGIVSSHVFWMLYFMSPFGTASAAMGDIDVASFYLRWFQ